MTVLRYTAKNICVGVGCALAANVLLVTNSILVNRYKLLAAELCFWKALLQMALFATIYFVQTKAWKSNCLMTIANCSSSSHSSPSVKELTGQNNNNDLQKRRFDWSRDWQLVISVIGCSITLSIMTLTVYIGVNLLPVSDLVVLCHTSSVFTLLFSACVLRLRITVLKALLCVTALSGAVMVVQPTFMFSKDATDVRSSSSSITTVNQTRTNALPTKDQSDPFSSSLPEPVNPQEGHNYYLGVIMSLTCAVFSALSNVLSAKAKECPLSLLMMVAGLGTFIVALICPFLDLPNRFIQSGPLVATLGTSSSLSEEMPYVAGVTVGSLLGGLLGVYACQVAPPALVAVVRSSEILLALFADYVIFQRVENPSLLHILGSFMTLASVALMAASDWIQNRFLDKQGCNRISDEKSPPPPSEVAPTQPAHQSQHSKKHLRQLLEEHKKLDPEYV